MPLEYTPSDIKRFYEKVSKTPTETGCLEWTASLRNGYGQFGMRKRVPYAHRLAWELVNGAIPVGMCACHTCDNRKCCNPAHIFLGSKADNTHDMHEKGRDANGNFAGEHIGTSKLTAEQVLEIRSDKYAGWKHRDIAEHFGVRRSAITSILSRKSWKHI